jgi:hypothetical protein
VMHLATALDDNIAALQFYRHLALLEAKRVAERTELMGRPR